MKKMQDLWDSLTPALSAGRRVANTVTLFIICVVFLAGCPGPANPPIGAVFEIGVATTGTGEGTAPAGSSTANGMYQEGMGFTATATPDSGSLFTGWYTAPEGGSLVSAENPYIGTMVGFTELFARFDLNITRYDLTTWELIGAAGWGAKIALGDLPEHFQIWNAPEASVEMDMLGLVFSRSIRWNTETLEWEPVLAEGWEIAPDETWVMVTLRDKLYWSDGTPLTATDFVFAALVYQSGEVDTGRDLSVLGQPTVWEALSNDTYRVTATGAHESLLEIASIEPLPEHILGPFVSGEMGGLNSEWRLNSDLEGMEIVGNGPFIPIELNLGKWVTLKKNPYYFEKDADGLPLPYLSAVRFMDGDAVQLFNSDEAEVCEVSEADRILIDRDDVLWVYVAAENVYEAYQDNLANVSSSVLHPFEGQGWRAIMARLYFE